MPCDMVRSRLQRWQIPGTAAVFAYTQHEFFGPDRLSLGAALSCPVHVGHDDFVNTLEGAGKLIQKETGSGILVRLENDPRSFGLITVPDRLDRNADFRRMVSVIINDRYPASLAPPGQTATNARESG